MNYLIYITMFGAMCSALMIIAFRPALQEWRHPTDLQPLPVLTDDAIDIDFFAERFRREAMAFMDNRLARNKNEFAFTAAEPGRTGWGTVAAPLISTQSISSDTPINCKFPIFVDGNVDATASNQLVALYALGAATLGPATDISEWAHAEETFFLGAASHASRRISSATAVELANECTFERISAPVIRFGQRRRNELRPERGQLTEASFGTLPRAVQRTDQLVLIRGDCTLPAESIYRESLIVTGKLSVGKGTRVIGNVKARKGIVIEPNALIGGALICESQIQIQENAMINGPVISESTITIENNVTIGEFGLPTTISAERIVVQSGVVTHGAVWARNVGLVWES